MWDLHFDQTKGGIYSGCSILRSFMSNDIPLDLGMSISFEKILISIENDGNVRLYDLENPQDGQCLKKIQMENSFIQKIEKIKDFVIVERGEALDPIMFLMDDTSKVCRLDTWDLKSLKCSTLRGDSSSDILKEMRDSVL